MLKSLSSELMLKLGSSNSSRGLALGGVEGRRGFIGKVSLGDSGSGSGLNCLRSKVEFFSAGGGEVISFRLDLLVFKDDEIFSLGFSLISSESDFSLSDAGLSSWMG